MPDLVTITEDDGAQDDALPVTADALAAEEKPAGLPERAELNDDGSVTLRMAWPASIKFKSVDGTVREEPIEELVFHRLRGGDLRAMMNTKGDDASLVLFTRSIRKGDGRGPLIYDALDAVDARAAMEIIGFLSGAGAKTGR